MRTLVIVIAVAGWMFGAADAHAARKRLTVHKTERLHENCSCSKGASPGLSYQTSGVDGNTGRAHVERALPPVDAWKYFSWLFALTITGAFMVKEPFAKGSMAAQNASLG